MIEMSELTSEEFRTCSRCGEVVETYSEIEYSQGDRVCRDCKKETLESDKRAFDRDMRYRS